MRGILWDHWALSAAHFALKVAVGAREVSRSDSVEDVRTSWLEMRDGNRSCLFTCAAEHARE